MKRSTSDIQDGQNYDSFLDIVANLVGILVILIMVIGVRARDAWQAVSPESASTAESVTLVEIPQAPSPTIDLAAKRQTVEEMSAAAEAASSEARRVKSDIHEMDRTIQEVEQQAATENLRRNELQLLISMSEQAMEARRSQLEESDQVALVMAKQIDASEIELAKLEDTIRAIDNEIVQPKILEHRPTPMARMVLGQEEHFRLLGGQLSHVPINEMTAMLQRDAGNKLWKLKNTDEITETIGPLHGYRMKYTLERREQRVATGDGPRVQKVVELQRFVMVPESSTLGESTERAIASGSVFDRQLSQWNPEETTITVWTYPDSFPEFRRLKSYLADRGFTAAARPLPRGFPIGGSPDGTKSAAE